ncbi:MAG: hypothetical protein RLN88_12910 [Ekhidna sp.]|uniref:hypothetical protein n=1 Tax=Ekhidna sp. TaxID=2608089 RepID=UPI0032EB19DB
MSQPKIEFYKIRDFGAKMNATIEFLRENMGRLFLNLLFIGGPVALLMSIIFTNIFSSMGDAVGIEDESQALNFFAVLGGNYFMIMLISWLAGSMVICVSMTYVRLYNEGVAKETPVGDVLKLALKKYGGVLLLGILVAFIVFISFFVFILPGIFMLFVLPLAFATYMFEDISAPNALGRTFTLLKDKWWSTFGIGLVGYILAYVIQLVFSLPTMVVYFANIFTLIEEASNNPSDPSAVFEMFSSGYMTAAFAISMVGGYLSYSIPLIAYSYQYANLVERSEGRGLMNEIEGFDKE